MAGAGAEAAGAGAEAAGAGAAGAAGASATDDPASDGASLRAIFDEAAELYDQARPGYPTALFDDLAGLQAYLSHPAHKELASRFRGALRAALIYEFLWRTLGG